MIIIVVHYLRIYHDLDQWFYFQGKGHREHIGKFRVQVKLLTATLDLDNILHNSFPWTEGMYRCNHVLIY